MHCIASGNIKVCTLLRGGERMGVVYIELLFLWREYMSWAPVAQSVSARYLYDSIEPCRGCEFEPHLGQVSFIRNVYESMQIYMN